MKSCSKFNLLQINNLNLVYKIDHYKNQSIRDIFINTIRSPISTIFEKENYYHVLKDINLTVNRGERIGVLGVNGAGKTSLCRCIVGMITPNSGMISLNGRVRGIFDTSVGVIPELTGRENAALVGSLLFPELSKRQLSEIVEDAIEFSELGEFANVPFSKYSKGMQTRLSLSLVSSISTDLLVLDEVYDGADLYFQQKISKRISKVIKDSGAVIFVSHSLDQIKAVCNRLILLENSKITFDGKVEDGIQLYSKIISKQGLKI